MNKPTDEIERSLARGTKNIGAMVYWTDIGGAKIARPLWRQGLKTAGVIDAVAADPGPDAMLSTAVSMATRRQARGDGRIRVELKDKGQFATYRVMMPRWLADHRKHDVEEATIAVDAYAQPDQAVLVPTTLVPGHDAIRDGMLEEIRDRFADIQGYVHGDEVSDALVAVMAHAGAISLRRGVYFVAMASVDVVRRVKAFIEGSSDGHVTVWNIRGDDENAAEARHDARQSFIHKLSKVIEEVKDFTGRVTADAALARSVNANVRKFQELDAQVQLYADVLGDYRDGLRTAIADARQAILGAYLGKADDSQSSGKAA